MWQRTYALYVLCVCFVFVFVFFYEEERDAVEDLPSSHQKERYW